MESGALKPTSDVLRRRDTETDTPSREAPWGQRHRLEGCVCGGLVAALAASGGRKDPLQRPEECASADTWISVLPPPEWEGTDFFVPSPAVCAVVLAAAAPRCSCGGHAQDREGASGSQQPRGAGWLPTHLFLRDLAWRGQIWARWAPLGLLARPAQISARSCVQTPQPPCSRTRVPVCPPPRPVRALSTHLSGAPGGGMVRGPVPATCKTGMCPRSLCCPICEGPVLAGPQGHC